MIGSVVLALAAVAAAPPSEVVRLIPGPKAMYASGVEPYVRVGILDSVEAVTFAAASDSVLVGGDGATVSLPASQEWVARRAAGLVVLESPGAATNSAVPPVRIVRPPLAPVLVGSRWYRGDLEILLAPDQGLTAVNSLWLEQYLYGVVPGEMPPSWPLEALKAQAVAARTYAVTRLGSRRDRGYDLKATVEDQVYGGLGLEDPLSTRAISETAGQILAYAGEPIHAYYCAGAGGYTEGAESVQGFERRMPGRRPGGHPYLQPVPDFDWDSPRWLWQVALARDDLGRRLAAKGIDIGAVRRIEVVERSYSGRVRWVRLGGDLGTREVSGPDLRFALGLNSALFSVTASQDGYFYFVGRGWGHGVGMSQWGARKLAEWGYDYDDILSHYYPGAELELFTR